LIARFLFVMSSEAETSLIIFGVARDSSTPLRFARNDKIGSA
jgi:hypothetical protein